MSDDRRVAMVSGAGRGIGLAIARALTEGGWFVSAGLRSGRLPADLDPALAEAVAYDATRPGSEADWAGGVLARHGRIDAVVANAAIMIREPASRASDDHVRELMEVNVLAPRRLAAAAWDALAVSGRGRVVIIASLSGKRVKSARSSLYSVSKFAAVGLAHALRHEGWDAGIRATAICPGLVATDMGVEAARGSLTAETMSQPADVGRLVRGVIEQPNTLSIAELAFNCQPDGLY